jgi:serine/threonine-protein kinase
MAKPRVFVSHSSLDAAFATKLVNDLNAAGAQAWLDNNDLGPGNFQQHISDALVDCEWFLLVLTRNALESDWVRMEVDAAIRLKLQQRIKELIFIKATDVASTEVPPLWGVFNIFDALTDYDAAIKKAQTAIGLSPTVTKPITVRTQVIADRWDRLIGTRLEQYDIRDELGRGSWSRVYRAFDTALKRDVAIKVIPTDVDDRPLFLSRFEREAQAIGQLHHPNIIQAYAGGESDEFVYLVMQCVTGGTLRRKMNGPLPVPEAVAYMVQMAYALHHAHSKGIIHRDVTPSNMLLEYPGSNHLLLTDFGIAKLQGALRLTKSGIAIGTPEYMSPEQAEGRTIDERADIYALGCVLYETLAGRPPFLGSTPVSVLFQHVHSRPAYIRGFNPGVPAELVHILEIALAKRPGERYQTARSFARALRPWADELPSADNW